MTWRRVITAMATVVAAVPCSVGGPVANAEDRTWSAGLTTLCSTETYIRVAGLNDSPVEVTIAATEAGANGQTVELLGPNASDELRDIFPVTIPAAGTAAATWDLPLPAHDRGLERRGNDRNLHGSWLPKQWLDENGLAYKGVAADLVRGNVECPPDEPPAPVDVPPVSTYSTSNSQLAANATDGDPGTAFVTQMQADSPPTWAWLTVDLGDIVPLVEVEWWLTAATDADLFWVETSTDGLTWTAWAEPAAREPGTWHSVPGSREARLVRWYWRRDGGAGQLGHLGEVRLWAAPTYELTAGPADPSVAALRNRSMTAPPPPEGLSVRGERLRVVDSHRSSNSPAGASRHPLDGDLGTSWHTAMTVPPRTGWARFDVGGVATVTSIRWTFALVGYADAYTVQVSEDGIRWTNVGRFTNAAAAGEWQEATVGQRARFVRFFFTNPNRDPNVGYVAEVRITGSAV